MPRPICISSPLPNTIRVGLLQLGYGLHFNLLEHKIELLQFEIQQDKIKFLLSMLGGKNPKVDFVVLPEYSITSSMVKMLIQLSNQFRMTIVGGSYHDKDTGQNICPIIIPDEPLHYCRKRYLTEFEKAFVKPSSEGGIEFHWKTDTSSFCIQVFLCLDYLATTMYPEVSRIDIERTGIIVVPMCSPEFKDFWNLSSIHLRHEKGKFVLLCNSAQTVFNGSSQACGHSAVFGSYYSGESGVAYASFLESQPPEGVLLTSLNLLNPKITSTRPTSITYQEAPLHSREILYLNKL